MCSLFFLVVGGFLLFRALPGDPVRAITRDRQVTPGQLAELRHRFGLDRSLPAQLWDHLGDVLRGDLGVSFYFQRPVAALIGERLWPTVLLLGTAIAFSAALGVWLGLRAGWRPGGGFDRVVTGGAIVLWSMPAFWLGMMLLLVLAAGAGPFPGLFPTGGLREAGGAAGPGGALDLLHHLVLPCLTLVLVVFAQYLLVMRSSVLGERASPYLVTARAKGLPEAVVRRRHVLPNVLLPTVTLVFTQLGSVVAGAVTVEAVYSWPGLGQLTYLALTAPDLPLLHGTFLVLSATVILANQLADLLYRFLDPRVRGS